MLFYFLSAFGCVFWGSAYLPFSYKHSVKSLPFSLSLFEDITDKVRIVVFYASCIICSYFCFTCNLR